MIYIKSKIGIVLIPILSFALLYCSLLEAPSNTATYTVRFEMDGGKAISSQKVTSGETAIKPTILTGIAHGCYSAVENWYSDAEFNKPFNFSTPITSNITLYIKWDESTFNTGDEPKTIDNIYQICHWKQLQWIAKDPERLDDDYILVKDIVLPNAGEDGLPVSGFIPIGYDVNPTNDNLPDTYAGIPFSGTLDGNNKTISNLFIDALDINWTSSGALIPNTILDNDFIGLFGQINRTESDPAVKNLTIMLMPGTQDNPSIDAKTYIGGLVGQIINGVIENVAIKDGYIQGKALVGGLIGRMEDGEVRGYNANTTIHNNDPSSFALSIGGLAGQAVNGTIIGYATGNIIAPTTYNVGGLVGSTNATIIGYATGSVNGFSDVGGLVGKITGGSITGYATGLITTSGNAGGLVASATNSAIFGYWDTTSTGQATSAGGNGISSTKNIVFNNGYVDQRSSVNNSGNYPIFNDIAFVEQFDITNGVDATLPKLKTTVFALPQPTISDVDKDGVIEVVLPAE